MCDWFFLNNTYLYFTVMGSDSWPTQYSGPVFTKVVLKQVNIRSDSLIYLLDVSYKLFSSQNVLWNALSCCNFHCNVIILIWILSFHCQFSSAVVLHSVCLWPSILWILAIEFKCSLFNLSVFVIEMNNFEQTKNVLEIGSDMAVTSSHISFLLKCVEITQLLNVILVKKDGCATFGPAWNGTLLPWLI